MSKKKDNFNEAVYSMFGVGKAPATEKPAEPEAEEKIAETVDELLADYVKEPESAEEEPVVSEAPEFGVTHIAAGTTVEGKLVSQGNVEIAGHFKGDVDAKGTVTISCDFQGNVIASELCICNCTITGDVKISGKVTLSEGSAVVGNVTAGDFTCCGNVKGDLDVTGNLTLKEKAQIEGNITMGSLMVEQGAVIQGGVASKKK
ncbi:MAG: polymer-forming cytoskeletal protein [Firmicutes bacterium]|nr:polymer-forming cytoskeletal protein [Bacillota bacterium]